GGEDSRKGGRGEDRFGDGAGREPSGPAVGQRRGHHLHREARLLEGAVRDGPLDQVPKTGVGLDGMAFATELPKTGDAPRGPELVAVEVSPHIPHAFATADARVP